MTYTKKLAQYVFNTKYEDIPASVIEKVKMCILDFLGCAIGALNTDEGKAVIEFVEEMKGVCESSVIGRQEKVPCTNAVFANSTLSNMLDFDDTFAGASHPGNTIMPAALAIAERNKASGKDLITSIVVGYEVATRIGLATRLSKEKVQRLFPGWSWQTIGAVAAACKILNLNVEQIENAFGLAGTCAPAPLAVPKLSAKPLGWVKNGFAWGAITGVFWTLIAAKNIHGSRDIFDDPGGFWEIIGSDQCFYEEMVDGLGESYKLLDLDFKPYPSCRWTHSSLEAIDLLVAENEIKPDMVKEIRVKTLARVEGFMEAPPSTMIDAQFCFPYMVAMVVLGITPGQDWFEKTLMQDERVMDLVKKTKCNVHPDADDYFAKSKGLLILAEVEIEDKAGKVYRKKIEYPKGSPQNPMTINELKQKFINLTSKIVSSLTQNEIFNWLENIENVHKISLPKTFG